MEGVEGTGGRDGVVASHHPFFCNLIIVKAPLLKGEVVDMTAS